jgi:hypothetical protein
VTKSTKKEEYCKALNRFLPDGTTEYVADLILNYETHFRITKKRKTKLGDYRSPRDGKSHQISVNGDLNKYGFLITTIHEFAHLTTYNKFKHKAQPHGKEWKNEFKTLFAPIFNLAELPEDIELSVKNYLKNAKASSCSDESLMRVLKRYDNKTNIIHVEDLNIGEKFKLKDKVFVKGKKLRKYYLCMDLNSKREYRVLGLAEIEKIKFD